MGTTLAVLLLFTLANVASAKDVTLCYCTEEIQKLNQKLQRHPIVSGCLLRGCCPDCSRDQEISWEVRINGPWTVTMRLSGVPSGRVINVDDVSHPWERAGLVITRSRTKITRIPRSTDESAVTAHLAVEWSGANHPTHGQRFPGAVVVNQLIGTKVVNSYRLSVTITQCRPISLFPPTSNNVRVSEVSAVAGISSKEPFALVTGAGSIQTDNLAADGDTTNVAVFSKGAAAWFGKGLSCPNRPCSWEVPRNPVLVVPIQVWIADKEIQAATQRALHQLRAANWIFEQNALGIVLEPQFRVVTSSRGRETIDAGCAHVQELTSSDWFRPGMLNAYFIHADGKPGSNCTLNRNVVYIGPRPHAETLAHEIGHAFGLPGHPEDNEECLTPCNLMREKKSECRTTLSLGQAFRMIFASQSQLNKNDVRNLPVSDCDVEATGPQCPPVGLGPNYQAEGLNP